MKNGTLITILFLLLWLTSFSQGSMIASPGQDSLTDVRKRTAAKVLNTMYYQDTEIVNLKAKISVLNNGFDSLRFEADSTTSDLKNCIVNTNKEVARANRKGQWTGFWKGLFTGAGAVILVRVVMAL